MVINNSKNEEYKKLFIRDDSYTLLTTALYTDTFNDIPNVFVIDYEDASKLDRPTPYGEEYEDDDDSKGKRDELDYSKIDNALVIEKYVDAIKKFNEGAGDDKDRMAIPSQTETSSDGLLLEKAAINVRIKITKRFEMATDGSYKASFSGCNYNEWNLPEILLFDTENRIIIKFVRSRLMCCYQSTRKATNIEEFCNIFFNSLPHRDDDGKKNNRIFVITDTGRGLDTVAGKINETTVDIKKTYNDDLAPVYEKIEDFVNSDERKCGIVILNGEPGTGKTTLLKHLITHSKKNFLFLPPNQIMGLSSPSFTNLLFENRDSIVVMEDCEEALKDRSQQNALSTVATLLNMSDGILGDVYNMKFICTFNADMDEVDKALMRKGRCIAKYTFKKLNKEKAKKLLNERGITLDKYEDMTLADIFYNEEDNGCIVENKKIGF